MVCVALAGVSENLCRFVCRGTSLPALFQQNLNAEGLLVLPVAAELAEVSAATQFLSFGWFTQQLLFIYPTHYTVDLG